MLKERTRDKNGIKNRNIQSGLPKRIPRNEFQKKREKTTTKHIWSEKESPSSGYAHCNCDYQVN